MLLLSNIHWIGPIERQERSLKKESHHIWFLVPLCSQNICFLMLRLYSYKEMKKSTQGLLLGLMTLTQREDRKIFSPKLAGQGDFLSKRPALLRESVVGCGRWMVAHLRGSEEKKTTINILSQ